MKSNLDKMQKQLEEAYQCLLKVEDLVNKASCGGTDIDDETFPEDFTEEIYEAFDRYWTKTAEIREFKKLLKAFNKFKSERLNATS